MFSNFFIIDGSYDLKLSNRISLIGSLYAALIRKLGDRKIDILLKDPTTTDTPILQIAKQTGIQL